MLRAAYEPKAAKFLKKLSIKEDVKRLLAKVEELTENPFPSNSKRVQEYHDKKVFRIRVGIYRILYLVAFEEKKLFVLNIDKRSKVY